VRLEIGPRDLDKDAVFAARRDRAPKDKQSVARAEFVATIAETLESIQGGLYDRAAAYRDDHTVEIDDRDEFYKFFTPPSVPEGVPTPIHGGFALTHFSGEVELEQKIKNDLGVTVRNIPLDDVEPGVCPFTGRPSAAHGGADRSRRAAARAPEARPAARAADLPVPRPDVRRRVRRRRRPRGRHQALRPSRLSRLAAPRAGSAACARGQRAADSALRRLRGSRDGRAARRLAVDVAPRRHAVSRRRDRGVARGAGANVSAARPARAVAARDAGPARANARG